MQALKNRLSTWRSGDKEKEKDPNALHNEADIHKAIKDALEQFEGIKMESDGDRIKNFFNDKFLRSMKKELSTIETHVHEISGSQKAVIESLDSYIEKIKKKFEEKADSVKNELMGALLEKNMTVNTSFSDLALASNRLQKMLNLMKDELKNKQSVLKVTVTDFVGSFDNYRKKLIKFREDNLVERTTERVANRMQSQTDKCAADIEDILDNNLSPSEIFTLNKQEMRNVSALEMLDLDDSRSTTNTESESTGQERKFMGVPSPKNSMRQVANININQKILAFEKIENLNLAAVSLENSSEILLYDVKAWKEVGRSICSSKDPIKIKYQQNKATLFASLKDSTIDVFKLEGKGTMSLFRTAVTNFKAVDMCYASFLGSLVVCFENATLQIFKEPTYQDSITFNVTGEQSIGAVVALDSQKLILVGSANDGALRLVDALTKSVVKTIKLKSTSICQMAVSSGTSNLMIGNKDGLFEVALMKTSGFDQVFSLPSSQGRVSSLAWVIDKKIFGVTNSDEYVRFYDYKGNLAHEYKAFMDDGAVMYLEKTQQYACIDLTLGQILILQDAAQPS